MQGSAGVLACEFRNLPGARMSRSVCSPLSGGETPPTLAAETAALHLMRGPDQNRPSSCLGMFRVLESPVPNARNYILGW